MGSNNLCFSVCSGPSAGSSWAHIVDDLVNVHQPQAVATAAGAASWMSTADEFTEEAVLNILNTVAPPGSVEDVNAPGNWLAHAEYQLPYAAPEAQLRIEMRMLHCWNGLELRTDKLRGTNCARMLNSNLRWWLNWNDSATNRRRSRE